MAKPQLTVDEFMDEAAEHGVTFKIATDEDGHRFAIGWPHGMSPSARDRLQKWVEENKAQLAAFLLTLSEDVRKDTDGVTFIKPDTEETKH